MSAAAALRVATHPQRYRLLSLLAERSRTVAELVAATGLAPNLVSHHLAALRRSRLVSVQQNGRERRYALDDRALQAAAHDLVASLGGHGVRPATARPRVLFVCMHNAGRSQMARAFFERAAGDAAVADSAGSDPAPRIHPEVQDAMREVGVRLRRKPRRVTRTMVSDADLVIDMGCGDAIPKVPGVRRVVWRLPDPAGRSPAQVRRIRDDIAERARRLAATLISS